LNLICIILIPITIIFTGFIVIIHTFTLFYLIIKVIIQYFLKEEEEEFWIPFEQLKKIELIANGGFGRVFKASLNDRPKLIFEGGTKSKIFKSGREVAIKYINRSNLSEFHAHKLCIKSKSVVPLLGISKDEKTGEFILVMKYAPKGNLSQYLSKNPKLTWKEKAGLILDIATGLSDIHRVGLIHGDFHSGNILISAGGKALISDLGLSIKLNSTSTYPVTTEIYGVIPYVAPELIRHKTGYSQAADVYSFGIVLWEICSGLKPYNDRAFDMFLLLDVCHRGERPKIHSGIPKFFISLIKSCWDEDYLKRPSMELVLKFVRNLYINVNFDQEILELDSSINSCKLKSQIRIIIIIIFNSIQLIIFFF
jgi:serine/threonine protein kinase